MKGEEMKRFSLEPDDHMRWIYDTKHPKYNSEEARDLRKRRDEALLAVPRWMRAQAIENDKEWKNDSHRMGRKNTRSG